MAEYYVAYSWSKENSSGFGRIDIKTDSDKLTLDVVKGIESEISNHCDNKFNIIILNIIRMDA